MLWSSEHQVFCAFFRILLLRPFHYHSAASISCLHYGIPPHGAIPDRKLVLSWVETFRTTGSVAQKRPGARQTVRTPKNVEAVRMSILQSHRRSS